MNSISDFRTFLGTENNNRYERTRPRPQSLRLGMALALTWATVASAQTYKVLKNFTGSDGQYPHALVLANSALYGMTEGGGDWNLGVVFKVNTDGSGFAVLKNFTDGAGGYPAAGLVLAGNTLYGTRERGGSGTNGVIFKLNTDGSGYAVLKNFTGSDGAGPAANLVLAGSTLYGTTTEGGSLYDRENPNGCGVVFKVNTDGSGYTVLKDFTDSDGACPLGLVLTGSTLYGVTQRGGHFYDPIVPSYACGVIFKMNTDGSGYTVLTSFTGNDGCASRGNLVLADNTLYGSTQQGGSQTFNNGVVFKVNTDGSGYTVLEDEAVGGLVLAGHTLYGTADTGSYGNGAVFHLNTDGGYAVIKNFTGSDGNLPTGDLVLEGSTLYGTTLFGGSSNCGVVFSLQTQATNSDVSGTWSVTTQCPVAIIRQFTSTPFGYYYPPGGDEPMDLNGRLGFSGAVSQAPDGSLSMATAGGTVFSGQVTSNYVHFTLRTETSYTSGTITTTETLSADYAGTVTGNIITGYVSASYINESVSESLPGRPWGVIGGTNGPFIAVITKEPPTIGIQPQGGTVGPGETVKLAVTAQGTQPLAYQWFKAGISLQDGGTVSGAQTSLLTLSDVQPAAAGPYMVVISNVVGAVTSVVATLTVEDPFIKVQPQGGKPRVGANWTLTVVAEGVGPLSYQWRKDGSLIPGATTSTLVLTNVQTADGGTYSAAVTSAAGSIVSQDAVLLVDSTQPRAGTVVSWGEQVIPLVPPGTRFKAIAAGLSHSLALKQDGTVVACGYNQYGQATVPGGLAGVVAIAAGDWHSLALKQDGTVAAWGTIYGDQGVAPATVPSGLSNVIAIAAGAEHSLALKQDGTVVAWGAGQTNDQPRGACGQSIVPGGLTGVTAVAAGATHSLALKQDGTVVAWGAIYNGCSICYLPATVPDGLSGVIAIAAGGSHSLALKGDGTVVAWGPIYRNGMVYVGPATVPDGLSGVTAIAAGDQFSMALKQDGTVVAWGEDAFGEADVPSGLSGVVGIAAGSDHSLALKADGTVVGWGLNKYGQAEVSIGLTGVTALAAGGGHSLALKQDGTIAAWGNISEPGIIPSTVPSDLSRVTAIAAGDNHSLALAHDGTVVGWGNNDYGQTNVPSGLSGVIAIAAGYGQSLALKQDRTVAAWGYNWYGLSTVPSGLSGVIAVAAGGLHSLALKQDGTVVAWGYNNYGQTNVPSGLSNVIAVAAGGSHSLALKQDGTVVAWGYIYCGFGPSGPNYLPATVPDGLSNVVAIAADGEHDLALRQDGTVVAWGDNSSGQSTVPVGLSNVIAIAAGGSHSLALVATSPPGPQISAPPQTQTAEAGSAIRLFVLADSSSLLGYQWFFNGTNAVSGATNSFLALTDVHPSQAGAYSVVVSNASGAVTSAPAVLEVIAPVEHRPVLGIRVRGEPGSQANVDYADALSPAPAWTALGSVSLATTPQYCFDVTTPLPAQRFYRAWLTGAPAVLPSLQPPYPVPAITLTGNVGDKLRLDYINQFGPIDAWVTLDTVTLTNTSQLYFDISASGYPPRLYRVVSVP